MIRVYTVVFDFKMIYLIMFKLLVWFTDFKTPYIATVLYFCLFSMKKSQMSFFDVWVCTL